VWLHCTPLSSVVLVPPTCWHRVRNQIKRLAFKRYPSPLNRATPCSGKPEIVNWRWFDHWHRHVVADGSTLAPGETLVTTCWLRLPPVLQMPTCLLRHSFGPTASSVLNDAFVRAHLPDSTPMPTKFKPPAPQRQEWLRCVPAATL
jgi:hypothetical protein